jgi:hypothetical protein
MEAVCICETSVYFDDTTRRYIPEGCHILTRHSENLKYHLTHYVNNILNYELTLCVCNF